MKINKHNFACNTLLTAVILYFFQQVLGLPSFVSRTLLLLIFFISILYTPKVLLNKEYLTPFILVWTIFLFHNTLMFLIIADYQSIDILKSVILNFLPFFPFYYFAKRQFLNKNKIIAFLCLVLPLSVMYLYQSTAAIQVETGKEDVVNNAVYMLMVLFPFLFLIRNKLITLSLTLLVIYLIILSNKRAAVVVALLSFIVFIVKDIYIERKLSKIKSIIASLIIIIISYPFIQNIFYSNETLVKRIDLAIQGDTAGRDVIINNIFDIWYNSNSIITYLFGLGYNSTLRYVGHHSHNDWVDMLTSFGIFGFFLYLVLFTSILLNIFKKNWDKNKRVVYFLLISIALIMSMTSRWYWANPAYLNFLLLPYLLATRQNSE